MRLLVLSLAAITGLSACAPIPNVHYFAPGIEGVVTRGADPVPGAEITVFGAFTKDTQTSLTGDDGRFHTDSVKEWRLIAKLFGDPIYAYTVEIRINGVKYNGYSFGLGIGYAPEKLQLSCDLTKPYKRMGGDYYCMPADGQY